MMLFKQTTTELMLFSKKCYRAIAIIAMGMFLLSFNTQVSAQICDTGVPTFSFDFTGHPDTVFNTGDISRNGACCGNSSSNCIHFDMILDAKTIAVVLNVTNGALPTGSFFVQIDCGTKSYGFGEPICITGAGHHDLTFCKPGNNTNAFSVTAVSAPTFPATDTVRVGCSKPLTVKGLVDSTITWQSVFPGNPGDYNSYLSCTSKCHTTIFTPQPGSPPYIDYQICGRVVASGCTGASEVCQTVRVYVADPAAVSVDQDLVNLTCTNPSVILTATPAPGTTLLWSPGGQTTSSITVTAPGTYTVTATSTTNGCTASASASAVVTSDFSTPQLQCGQGDNLTCSHPTGTIGVTTVPGVTFVWNRNGVSISDATSSITVSEPGTYCVVATKTSSGCTESCCIVVTEDLSIPNLQCGQGDNLTCLHTSADIGVTADAGVTFAWSGPSIVGSNTGSGISVNGPGTYTVVATKTSSGCTQTCSIVVTQDISIPNLVCGQGDNLTCTHTSGTIGVTANSGVTFVWSGPGIIGSNTGNNINVNAPGAYSVVATKTSSGCTQSCSIVVTQDLTISPAHAGPDKVISCYIPQVNLSANPIPAGVSYSWNAINGGHIISGSNTATPLVDAAGCYVLTTTFLASGCISRDTACITGNTIKPICSIIGPLTPPDSNTTGNILTSTSTNANTYQWSVSNLPSNNPWVITSSTNGTSITYTAGTGVGLFKLVVTNTTNGCVDSCMLAVGVNGSKYCMYGQGAYGNKGGVHCNGLTTPAFMAGLLSTPLVLGGGSNILTLYQADVNCIISRMPGGGAFAALNGVTTCANPTGILLFKNGRFRNGLLTQTITYGLNLRICNIGNVTIFGPYMVTYGASGGGCCTLRGIVQNSVHTSIINIKVWNYLNKTLGHAPTFNELFIFANQALAGTYVPSKGSDPSLPEIASAVEAINSAFAGCSVLAGFSKTAPRYAIEDQPFSAEMSEMTVKVFPNPFNSTATIEFTPNYNYDNVNVEIFNLGGALIKALYNGSVNTGETYRWDVNGSNLAEGIYLYRVVADGEEQHGKLILIK